LAVEAGAMLIIDSLTVELEQQTGSVIVAFGDLFLSLATIQGRDGDRLATTDGTRYRPFIVAYDASHTVIRDSHLVALGFDTFGTTGLAVMTVSRDEPAAHPELSMVGTLVDDVFDGVFVRGGGKVELLRNIVTGTGRHGIVVRDETAGVLIAENVVTGSGAAADNGNGIVVSRGVRGAVVVANRTENSAASGILVERDVGDLAISGNQLIGSGRDGLIVYESSGIDVVGNGIVGSGRSGIRVRASDGIRIEGNALEGNARTGVDAHDWTGASREPNDEERPLIRPTVVTVTGNRFAGNERGPCLFEGVVTVLPAGASDC
jgi:parallel beta-helix repeat protein